MGNLKETTDWLRADARGAPLATDDQSGVDRNAGIIRGMIVAQEGVFKSEGRGEFDKKGLRAIVKLMKAAPNGLKSRLGHPSLSDDGIGKLLGRVKNPRMDTITTRDSEGTRKDNEINVVRGDLHIDPSSRSAPGGDLGGYIMDLAESDPDAMSSSLVLQADQETRLDSKGRPKRDTEDNELPPLWRPLALHASDVVDTGDAVDGFLSAETIDGLPDAVVRRACELLDTQFGDADRETIEARCQAWLGRYLNHRFGEPETPATDALDAVAIDAEPVPDAVDEPPEYDPARDPVKAQIRRRREGKAESEGN